MLADAHLLLCHSGSQLSIVYPILQALVVGMLTDAKLEVHIFFKHTSLG